MESLTKVTADTVHPGAYISHGLLVGTTSLPLHKGFCERRWAWRSHPLSCTLPLLPPPLISILLDTLPASLSGHVRVLLEPSAGTLSAQQSILRIMVFLQIASWHFCLCPWVADVPPIGMQTACGAVSPQGPLIAWWPLQVHQEHPLCKLLLFEFTYNSRDKTAHYFKVYS